jgi:hypothetical protein
MLRLRFVDNAIAITDSAPSIHLHVPYITEGGVKTLYFMGFSRWPVLWLVP